MEASSQDDSSGNELSFEKQNNLPQSSDISEYPPVVSQSDSTSSSMGEFGSNKIVSFDPDDNYISSDSLNYSYDLDVSPTNATTRRRRFSTDSFLSDGLTFGRIRSSSLYSSYNVGESFEDQSQDYYSSPSLE